MRSPLRWWLALALITAACARGEAQVISTTTSIATTTSRPTTTPPPSTTTILAGPLSPLNGLPVEDPDLLARRVLAVKIDNHPDARPQSGIELADAVIELPVEGITRFIALFLQSDSDYLGPVRSGRPTDGALLNPLDATFVISGAQRWVQSLIREEDVNLIGEERPATFRIRQRRAPHNLYADTVLLRDLADERDYPNDPPPPLWAFDELTADAEAADRVVIDFGNGSIVTWEWDQGRYLRSHGAKPSEWITKDGETGQIGADTLVLIFARRYIAAAPAGGTNVPAMDTVGSGRVVVFAGGRVTEGRWQRDSSSEPFELTDEEGEVLAVPAGIPWISIVPEGNAVNF